MEFRRIGYDLGFDDRFRIGFGLPTDELAAGLERVGRVIEARAD